MRGYAVELRVRWDDGRRHSCIVELQAEDSDHAIELAVERAQREFPEGSVEVSDRPYRYRGAPRRPRLIRPRKVV